MIPETVRLTLNLKLYFIVGGWMTAEKTNPFLKQEPYYYAVSISASNHLFFLRILSTF